MQKAAINNPSLGSVLNKTNTKVTEIHDDAKYPIHLPKRCSDILDRILAIGIIDFLQKNYFNKNPDKKQCECG